MSSYESLSRTYDSSTETDIDVADVTSICNQRRMRMLFNTPPVRFTPISPYTYNANGQLNYTKHQLDMRRKVEILKHNKSSTQGNKPTKKEQWAHINSRKYSIRKTIGNATLLPGATVVSGVDCSTVATSSKQADVPGPNIQLQLDKSVPLYRYLAPTRTYATFNTEITDGYEVVSNGDIKTFYSNVYGFLAALKILKSIDETSKYFTMVLPFTLGYSKNTGVSDALVIPSGTISLVTPQTNTTQIYYNGMETNSGTHGFSVDQNSATFETSVSNTVESGTVGTIVIDHIFVETQPNYFYEVAQSFELSTNMSLALVTPCLNIRMDRVEFRV